jgi:hypothetical protein
MRTLGETHYEGRRNTMKMLQTWAALALAAGMLIGMSTAGAPTAT